MAFRPKRHFGSRTPWDEMPWDPRRKRRGTSSSPAGGRKRSAESEGDTSRERPLGVVSIDGSGGEGHRGCGVRRKCSRTHRLQRRKAGREPTPPRVTGRASEERVRERTIHSPPGCVRSGKSIHPSSRVRVRWLSFEGAGVRRSRVEARPFTASRASERDLLAETRTLDGTRPAGNRVQRSERHAPLLPSHDGEVRTSLRPHPRG